MSDNLLGPFDVAIIARFWARVDMHPGLESCWLWTGPPDGNGYGRASIGHHRVALAHRVSYAVEHGPLAPDVCVLHRCDNPPCVRPDHLFPGDRGVNARDMAAKGRQHVQRNPGARPVCPMEKRARGEGHGNAKLTAAAVLAIRERAAAGETKRHLAREFGVTPGIISSVSTGSTWKHVGGPRMTPRPTTRNAGTAGREAATR